MGIGGCIVEGDLVVVIGSLGKGDGSRQLAHVHEIRELSILLGISLVHAMREQNGLTYKFANWGIGLSSMFSGSVIPDSCL